MPTAFRADPESYQEVPEHEPEWQRQLAAAVWSRFASLTSWFPFVTNVVMAEEVDRLHNTPPKTNAPGPQRVGGYGVARPYMSVTGPASILSGYWLPVDVTHTPTVPSDPAWSSGSITPYECLATYLLPREEAADARGFTTDGGYVTVPAGESKVDPFIARYLAEGLSRAAETAFFQGAGSDADPVAGLAGQSGIRTAAFTGALYDDIVGAIATLRIAKRYPSGVAVSVSAGKALRLLKDGAGRYQFDPTRPMSIDGVPIFISTGIPSSSASGYIVVADFSMAVVLWRVMANGLLAKIDRSDHVSFQSDQRRYRAACRWNLGLVPGAGPDSVFKITSVEL